MSQAGFVLGESFESANIQPFWTYKEAISYSPNKYILFSILESAIFSKEPWFLLVGNGI